MFKAARIKLTAWYLLIIMTVTLCFSTAVYSGVQEVTRRALDLQQRRIIRQFSDYGFRPGPPPDFPVFNEETAAEIRERILLLLGFINMSVLLLAGGLGYILAGRTLKPIENMVDKQKRFISDAAHEIKTPLTAMKADLEVTFRDKKLTVDDAKSVMQSTVLEIDKLHNLTEQLLIQSKFQNGTLKTKPVAKVNLGDVINQVVEKHKTLAKQNNVEIVTTTSKDVYVMGVEEDLTRMFQNLVNNAIKYSKKEGKVEITLKTSNTCAVITVTDHGDGIKDKDLPFVFDPFYRADKSRSKNTKEGTGLGLTIAREIVLEHKGNIKVTSRVGEETIFTVTLPNAKA